MQSKMYLETIRSVDGSIKNIAYHQERYESVLRYFGVFEFQNLECYLHPPQSGLYRCRLLYDLEGNISVTYHKYHKRNISSLKLLHDETIEYTFKSIKREKIDRLFALREEFDDVLIVKNNLLRDTTVANIALYCDGIWFTPKTPLLRGTTRERLLREGKIIERDIHVDTIYNYSRVALLNAMIDFDIIAQDNIRRIFC